MSLIHDLLVAPPHRDRAADDAPGERASTPRPPWRPALLRPRDRTAPDGAGSPAVGLLAPIRELQAAAAAVGLELAGNGSAVLVCVHSPGQSLAPPPLRALPRPDARRLAAALAARGLAADVRGRLVLVALSTDTDELGGSAARALAAAGTRPTVLATAVRHDDLDVLLRSQDALLVALPPDADPALAALALAGARALASRAAVVPLGFDLLTRALAIGGLRAPRAVGDAVREALT